MRRHIGLLVAIVMAIAGSAGCAQAESAETFGAIDSEASSALKPRSPDLYVADTGVEDTPALESVADWSFNVNDPITLREHSSAVISAKVTRVERSFVSENGTVVTSYLVEVGTVYKGENLPDVISVTLPGGSVPLGEYISAVDELGLYGMKLGRKDAEIVRSGGVDPSTIEDPRTMDPVARKTENWRMNPTSESLISELDPDSWVFFLHLQDGIYYGTGFDHALSYLKDGHVYSLHSEAERSPIAEEDLLAG